MKVLIIVVAIILVIAAAFLILHFSNDKIVITIETLNETLEPISELNTASFEYSGNVTRSSTRTSLGMNIPGTTNSVKIVYSGVIQLGYDVSAIQKTLDAENKTIYISLPEPEITGNYIDTQNLEFETSNNIFNPIDAEDLFDYLKEIQADELERATAAGMYETADGQMKTLIAGLLAVFEDYTVQFISGSEFAALDITGAEDAEEPAEEPKSTDAAEPAEEAEPTDAPESTDAPEATDAPEVEQTQKPAA